MNIENNIILIFLSQRTLSLEASEIATLIGSEDVRTHIENLNPALFQIETKVKQVIVHVKPQIEICNMFLRGKCHNVVKLCDKLHICRDFGNCRTQNCRFPHDLGRGRNREIVEKYNCQNIHYELLVELIRLKHRSTSQNRSNQNDKTRQIDVSYPSLRQAPSIDTEIIDMIIQRADAHIEKCFDLKENEYFRRNTIQLQRIEDTDKILISPIFFFENSLIKFKRTKKRLDLSAFVLRISINDLTDRISIGRMKLYVSLIIDPDVLFNIYETLNNREQNFYIQCNRNLDFNKIQQQHQTRPHLQGKNVTFLQVYESDTAKIRFIDEKKIITDDHVFSILHNELNDIFYFEVLVDNSSEVEFINPKAFKVWLSRVQGLESKFHIKVTPCMNYVSNENENKNTYMDNSVQNTLIHNESSSCDTKVTKITLRPQWTMVANHPRFQKEYQDYIHENLGGEIHIREAEVLHIQNAPSRQINGLGEKFLANKTNNYMQKLRYETLSNLESYHFEILARYSDTIAHKCIKENKFMIAGKRRDVSELIEELYPMAKNTDENDTKSRETGFNNKNQGIAIEQDASKEKKITLCSTHSISNPNEVCMFSIAKFEDRLQGHLKDTFNVQTTIERNSKGDKVKIENVSIQINLFGQTNDVKNATEDIVHLFTQLRAVEFRETSDGNWTKIDEVEKVIQCHLLQADILCSCQRILKNCVRVHYFDENNLKFGTSEKKIRDLIDNRFSSAMITFSQSIEFPDFLSELNNAKEAMRQRDDYKRDICIHHEKNTIYLFGLTKLVKQYRQHFEEFKLKTNPKPCKINLSEKQIEYLTKLASKDLDELEETYKKYGCQINLIRLKQFGDFWAPSELHQTIKTKLELLTKLNELTYKIESNSFAHYINAEPQCLESVIQSRCCIETKVSKMEIVIEVPRAQIDTVENVEQSTAISNAITSTSLSLGNSKIHILPGDLAKQHVDAIVVCSTSKYLRNEILKSAGSTVTTEYAQLIANGNLTFAITNSGALPCKHIYFIASPIDNSNREMLQSSLVTFISTAMNLLVKQNYKTIAFPSVGCGKLMADPSLVAKYMIDESRKQLKKLNSNIDVSFVIFPSQKNVYDQFVKYLGTLTTERQITKLTTPPSKINSHHSNICYELLTVEITLISPDRNVLQKSKHEIVEFTKTFIYESKLSNLNNLPEWSYETTEQYYRYCLEQNVIPKIDFNERTLILKGQKDAVNEAEKQYYEVTNRVLTEARLKFVGSNVSWLFEEPNQLNMWTKYSRDLNKIIEDAYLKKLRFVDIENDKKEKCRIVFTSMVEISQENQKRLRRTEKSVIPDNWECSDRGRIRFVLQTLSQEYQDVLDQFKSTMNNQYSEIVNIERIQNERWYKQYVAHKEEYKQRYDKLDERSLFHGCSGDSAEKITKECFNRSFAGVNGVAYGNGVYFHSHASYSHAYAKPDQYGRRTMFLARVLIGKTCIGKPNMKVPLDGCDTTTDGHNIFVIYHDAAAYATYLITYK